MPNLKPKGGSRFDDDADFAASFVLDRGEVEAALATESTEPSSEAAAPVPEITPSSKRWIFAGLGAAAVLLVVALSLLGRM